MLRRPAEGGEGADAPPPATRSRAALPRLHPLDWLAAGLLAAGVLCVATGLLPASEAGATMSRIGPLLVFLLSVIVLAELTGRAGVFDAVAVAMARVGRGRYLTLFLLCTALASLTTITLNLDTTAVLLTPVMLALAVRSGIAALPLAMTTVWLANTASLLLPVSNLTNLLAADRVALSPAGMAEVMWAPQLAAIGVTMVCLWVFWWRRGRRGADRYPVPEPTRPPNRALFRICALAVAGFVAAVLADLPLWLCSTVAAAVVALAFARLDRAALVWSLVPWRLLVLVPGIFLVVGTVSAYGLDELLRTVMGQENDAEGMARAAAAGAALSNVVNNLPVYVAGEAAVPEGGQDQLLALLIGVNLGPLVTPWASLATLLWFERCHAYGVRVPLRRFMLTGLVLAVTATTAATAVLAWR